MTEITPDFVKKDTIIEQIISDEICKRSSGLIKTTFTPDTITECSRKLIYMVTNNNYHNKIDYFKIISDIYTRKKWIACLSKIGGIKLLKSDLVVADCHFNLSGVIDAIVDFNQAIFVVKIFPVDENRFLTIQNKGAYKKDVIEVLIYMWLAELKNGLAIYENKNNHEYLLFNIEPYKPIIMSVKRKCLELSEFNINGKIPPRPYKVKSAKECERCVFLSKCWGEE